MRIKETAVYTFEELNDAAKEKARDWWRGAGFEFEWCDESRGSIEAFAGHFGAKLTDWNIGPWAPLDYTVEAGNECFRGRKLRDFKRDFMPTGYALDCALWQTFHDEFKRTGDAKGAFESAIEAGFKEWRADMESQLSDEYIEELLIANGYEFTADGERA